MANLSNINNKFLVTTTGEVLVGRTAATGTSKLQVSGSLLIGTDINSGIPLVVQETTAAGFAIGFMRNTNATNGNGLVIDVNSTGGAYIQDWRQASTVKMRLLQNGNLGIGTDSPAVNLQVEAAGAPAIAMSSSVSITSGSRGDLAWYNSSVSTVANIRADTDTSATADNVGTDLAFFTRAIGGSLTQKMVLKGGGNIGIGTTGPNTKLEVRGGSGSGEIAHATFTATANRGLKISTTSSPSGQNSGTVIFNAQDTEGYSQQWFQIGGTTKMVIDNSGNSTFYGSVYLASASNEGKLFFGTADAQYNTFGGGTYGYMGYNTGGYHRFLVNGSNRLQLEDGEMKVYSTAGLQVLRLTPDYIQTGRMPIKYPYYRVDSFKSDGSGYFWAFGHEKSDGTQSIGMMLNDGVSGNKYTRIINTLQIASFTSNEYNGAYPSFTTNVVLRNNGNSYLNGGNVGIGTTLPRGKGLEIFRAAGLSSNPQLIISTGENSSLDYSFATDTVSGGDFCILSGVSNTASAIKMRFHSNDVFFGTPTSTYPSTNNFVHINTQSSYSMVIGGHSGTHTAVLFRHNGATSVGSIVITSSSTSYNTSSDYRLKENVVEMNGALDRVGQLKPSRFNFIGDKDTTVDGFLAHEVQEIVPEAISGEKDAIDKDGNPDYQGIDQSKLVPLLVAAIQELKADNDSLKARIETLEDK